MLCAHCSLALASATSPSQDPRSWTWSEEAWLTADEGYWAADFGLAVSLSGDTVLIGAPSTNDNSGCAYVLVRDGSSWSQQAVLVPSVPLPEEWFGLSVSLDGERALIGASGFVFTTLPGAVYVFERTGTTWSEQARLTPSDATPSMRFGDAVSLDGDLALVGAPWKDTVLVSDGAVYVFARSGSSWVEQAKLTASAGNSNLLGAAVSLSGDHALVGAPGSRPPFGGGAAYVFSRQGTS